MCISLQVAPPTPPLSVTLFNLVGGVKRTLSTHLNNPPTHTYTPLSQPYPQVLRGIFTTLYDTPSQHTSITHTLTPPSHHHFLPHHSLTPPSHPHSLTPLSPHPITSLSPHPLTSPPLSPLPINIYPQSFGYARLEDCGVPL